MPKSPQFLANRLRSEGEKMTTFFTNLDDTDWACLIYTEDSEWTVRNILAHFVTTEQGFLELFPDILESGEGVSEDFDINRYNARQQEKTADFSPSELLMKFQEVRAKMINWVATLSAEDLAQKGRHPFLGKTTLEEMLKLLYRHNQIHYRDMRKVLFGNQ